MFLSNQNNNLQNSNVRLVIHKSWLVVVKLSWNITSVDFFGTLCHFGCLIVKLIP